MIGTRLDTEDAPRLIPSENGWWFIGNQTWTLLRPDQVTADRTITPAAEDFLRRHGAYQPRVARTFSLTVLTSTACNLGCGYCFQNTGEEAKGQFRPARIVNKRLSTSVVDRIVAFTAQRMSQAGLNRLNLLLFGGEPLLNPAGCLELLRRTEAIGRDFASMATNAVLLTPALARELNDAGLRGVQVTFDGSREEHDAVRVRRSGGGTFDAIVENLSRAMSCTDLQWHFRVNVSHRNVDRIGDLFGQLAGRIDPTRCSLTFAWVGDSGVGYANDLGYVDSVSDRFIDWSIRAVENGFHVSRPSMRTTCQICSVPGGDQGAVVNADGVLYSCWQSAGKAGWQVGTVDSGYLEVAAVKERWVTCGYEYHQGDPLQVDRFQDRVDGRLLDYLYATNRLVAS